MSLNNLSSSIITPGQVLILPSKEGNANDTNYQTYTVQKGDTLYSIARKFNVNVNRIKEVNNLISNTLYIGQKLQIPNT